MKELWIVALAKGVCPLKGCDISTAVCGHLNRYLQYSSTTYTNKKTNKVITDDNFREAILMYSDEIDDFSLRMPETTTLSIWEFFKKVRRYGLSKDQVQIIIRKFVLNMTNRQIIEEMGYTSHSTFNNRYTRALETLKKRGYGK